MNIEQMKAQAKTGTFDVLGKAVRGAQLQLDGSVIVCFYTHPDMYLWTINGAHRDEGFIAHMLEQHDTAHATIAREADHEKMASDQMESGQA